MTRVARRPGNDGQTRLYRFSYNSGTKTYTLDNGFPATMRTNIQSRDARHRQGLDRDALGDLDAGTSGSNASSTRTTPLESNDASWSTPAVLPVGNQGVGVTTDVDDISTIIAFRSAAEHRIGVFWSNQDDDKDYFAWHVDGTADATWTAETAIAPSGGNPKPADDHMNIKTTSDGTIYAVVKTSKTRRASRSIEDMLVRQPDGGWSSFTVARADSAPSRGQPDPGDPRDRRVGRHAPCLPDRSATTAGRGDRSGQSGGYDLREASPTFADLVPGEPGTPVMRDATAARHRTT